jgi:Xaa-Pro dipeptidase
MSAEAALKRELALEAAGGRLVTSRPADVRWLLCGRGRPVDAAGSASPYTVVLENGAAWVFYQDIERSRVETEEQWEELGYEPVPYPWFEGHGLEETPAALDEVRRELCEQELERYRRAGADAAGVVVQAIESMRPEQTEVDVAAELARRARAREFFPAVVLVAGAERQRVHRHPLPTEETLGRHALVAVTLEREGLYTSMTRLVSFGPPPEELARLAQATAEVDAAVLDASSPGVTLGECFGVLAGAYEGQGFRDEWRYHHQGGLTGYRGREVFAVPGDETRLPEACAVAWNPSITGGSKSEDTALVTAAGVEIVTRTPDLGELETAAGIPRPAIVEL